MHLINKQVEELNLLDVPLTRRPDFQLFWKETSAKVKSVPLNIKMRRVEMIDHKRIAAEGASQGGGASLIVSALHPSISLCLADVPSFSFMEKRLFERFLPATIKSGHPNESRCIHLGIMAAEARSISR